MRDALSAVDGLLVCPHRQFQGFLFADVLRRVLEQHGYRVVYVMNVTDVGHMTQDHLTDTSGEDKLAKPLVSSTRSVRRRRPLERAFVDDAVALRLKSFLGEEGDPSRHPRATAHVAEMLVMIQKLIEREFARRWARAGLLLGREVPGYSTLYSKAIDRLESRCARRPFTDGATRATSPCGKGRRQASPVMQWNPHSADGWPAGEWGTSERRCRAAWTRV
ncbi:MAG: hypothetical protein U0263_22920 [Polyangiaceae bacterium]